MFPTEPKSLNDEFVSPLREFDNVLLTPHVGGSTEEAQQNIGIEVAEKLIRYSNNGSTLSSVKFPEVSLPEHPGQLRLLHIHCNQPGVLSALNRIFSEHDINVTGEHLQTNARHWVCRGGCRNAGRAAVAQAAAGRGSGYDPNPDPFLDAGVPGSASCFSSHSTITCL